MAAHVAQRRLSEREVTHVAMEATGVYWKPVWPILEGDFELVLANAMQVKNVPGRKADLTRVLDRYGIGDVADLVERKRAGERVGVDSGLLDAWRPRIDGLFARLDQARETSMLPEE